MKDTLRFEGLYVEGERPDVSAIERTVGKRLAGWSRSGFLYDDDNRHWAAVEMLVRPGARAMSIADGWDLAHELASDFPDIEVEPMFRGVVDLPPPFDPLENLAAISGPVDAWQAEAVGLRDAWARFAVSPGAGIVVGHPDTGYTKHGELGDAAAHEAALAAGQNFVESGLPLDPLENGFGEFGGHGTATGSLIVSADAPGLDVVGAAPGARLMPLRVADTVVTLGWTRRLAQAIEYAVDNGAHVISISLGGLPTRRLRRAVRYAHSRGVILVAAAGNVVQFAVWPAAYEEAIACAAVGPDLTPWIGSSKGPAVDICAPGHRVQVAGWDQGHATFRRSSGTSFATALVAGAAALWLSHHGVEELRNRFPGRRLPQVFRQALLSSAKPFSTGALPSGWFGAGLLRADRLMDAPLVEPSTLELPRGQDPLVSILAVARAEQAEHTEAAPLDLNRLLSRRLRAELAFHAARDLELVTALAEASTRAELAATVAEIPAVSAVLRGALQDVRPPPSDPAPRPAEGATSPTVSPSPPESAAASPAGVTPTGPSSGQTAVTIEIPLRVEITLGEPRLDDE